MPTGRTPCEGESRDYKHQILPETKTVGGKHDTNHPSKPLEGTNLTDTLISYFWPPELEDNTFLLAEPPILCSYTLGKNMCKPHI